MNIDNNRLSWLSAPAVQAALAAGEHIEQVPSTLDRAAKKALRGRSEVTISKTSGGKLSKWAAGRRKARRKMEKETRRKQRR